MHVLSMTLNKSCAERISIGIITNTWNIFENFFFHFGTDGEIINGWKMIPTGTLCSLFKQFYHTLDTSDFDLQIY